MRHPEREPPRPVPERRRGPPAGPHPGAGPLPLPPRKRLAFLNRRAWVLLYEITKPFFLSSLRWRAIGTLLAILGLLLTLSALNVANSYVGRNFMTAIAQRDQAGYAHFAILYLCVFAASAIVGALFVFLQDLLALSWRNWMTQHLLGRYVSGRGFERLRGNAAIDNPDERISMDVRSFTGTLLSFAVMVTNSLITTLAFAGVLWSITPALLLTALAYAAGGSLLTVLLGYRLVALNHRQLKTEADLRFGLIQVRQLASTEGSEGLHSDERRIGSRLRRVIRNSRKVIGVSRNVAMMGSGYGYLIQLIPVAIVVPAYFRGEIDFGVVTQSAMAFAQIVGAFSLIIVQFGSISAFAAVVGRVASLWEEMEAAQPPA